MTQAEKLSATLNRTRPERPAGRTAVWKCNLFARRTALGLTLRDIQKATGVNNATLSQAEHGADTRLSTAVRIARFFGCPVEEMWTEEAR